MTIELLNFLLSRPFRTKTTGPSDRKPQWSVRKRRFRHRFRKASLIKFQLSAPPFGCYFDSQTWVVCNPISRSFDPAPSATPDVPQTLWRQSKQNVWIFCFFFGSYTTRDASGSTWSGRNGDRIAANCVEREEGCPSRPFTWMISMEVNGSGLASQAQVSMSQNSMMHGSMDEPSKKKSEFHHTRWPPLYLSLSDTSSGLTDYLLTTTCNLLVTYYYYYSLTTTTYYL